MSDDNTMRETVRRARELMAFVSAKPDDWSEHNALIASGLCNDELPALCDDNEQLRADMARVTAERDEVRAELLRRTAECDEVRARGRELRREVEALKVERDALRAIVEGRTVAPSREEMLAHWSAGGYWMVLDAVDQVRVEGVRERRDLFAGAQRIVAVDRDGRPCAWPVVEVSR